MGVDIVTEASVWGDTKVNVPDWGDLEYVKSEISKRIDGVDGWISKVETKTGKVEAETKTRMDNIDNWIKETIGNYQNESTKTKSALDEVIRKIDTGCLQESLIELINEHISKIDDECAKHKESIESSVKSAKVFNDAVNKKLGNIQNIVQGEVASFKEFVNKKVIADLKGQKQELDNRYTQISKKSDELNSLNSEIESNLKEAFEKFNKEVELQKAEIKADFKNQQEELDKKHKQIVQKGDELNAEIESNLKGSFEKFNKEVELQKAEVKEELKSQKEELDTKHNQIVQTSEELKVLNDKIKSLFETKEKILNTKLENASKEFADYADFKSKTTSFTSRLKWLFFN